MNRMRPGALRALLALLLICAAIPASGQDAGDPPVLVTADSLQYDQSLGLVRAEGRVELTQGGRTLLADAVSYSERDDKVVASGNVSLLEDTGSVLFADYLELTGGMRNGFVRDISFLLADNSRGAAPYAQRIDGNRTVMRKAVYTACTLCEEDPTRAPLWQIKGGRVEHNEAKQEITYRDAVLEFFGVPVLYTPYFSHADPTVNRRSGVLPPRYINNSFFGSAFQVPYYMVIDDYSDATITPQYSTDRGAHLTAEYRQRRATGEMQFDGSITDEQISNEVRGHFRGNMQFRASEDVVVGANIFRASDDTYISRYNIADRPSSNTLTSRVYAQAMHDRHFASANAISFQNLRSSVRNGSVPIVAPLLDYSAIFEPGDYGGRWAFDANLVSLQRSRGTDTRRLSTTTSWSQPYYAPSGEVYTATAMLRADGYWVNGLNESIGATLAGDETNTTGRVMPLIALDWRYPFVRDTGTMRQLIEPIVLGVVSPYGGNSKSIPNEDSLSFEFDETNLFSLSRFPGLDRWDGGPRVSYGMRTAAYANRGGHVELLVGQSLRSRPDDTFVPASGLRDEFSDYVGRLTISPGRYITLVDRLRLSKDNYGVERHELGATFGTTLSNLSVSYADMTEGDFLRDTGRQRAVSTAVRLQMTEYWSTEFRHVRDLGDEGGSLLNFAGLRYTDECFDIILFAERTFVLNRDIEPATTIGLRFRIASFS